jgi:hypothetical protein
MDDALESQLMQELQLEIIDDIFAGAQEGIAMASWQHCSNSLVLSTMELLVK